MNHQCRAVALFGMEEEIYTEQGLEQASPTHEQAVDGCREIHLENPELMTPLRVRAMTLGQRVLWVDPSTGLAL